MAGVRFLQMLDRAGRPVGDPKPVHYRRAAGLVSRGRARFVDAPSDDGTAAADGLDVPTPGKSTVADLLAAVDAGLLDAQAVLDAEYDRPNGPRVTILNRLEG